MNQRIDVYDTLRKEWRSFEVVPPFPTYTPKCGNGLHQYPSWSQHCACGRTSR